MTPSLAALLGRWFWEVADEGSAPPGQRDAAPTEPGLLCENSSTGTTPDQVGSRRTFHCVKVNSMSLSTDAPTAFPAHDPPAGASCHQSFTPLNPDRVGALITRSGSASKPPSAPLTTPPGRSRRSHWASPAASVLGSVPDGREVRPRRHHVTDCDDRRCWTCPWASAPCSSATSAPRGRQGQALPGRDRHAVRDSVADLDRRRRAVSSSASAWTCCGSPTPAPSRRCTRCASRVAFTGREGDKSIEGRLPRRYDGLSVSVKPGIGEIGPRRQPDSAGALRRQARCRAVAYNDLGQMERKLAEHGGTACLRVDGSR